jgi:hypothetical protein
LRQQFGDFDPFPDTFPGGAVDKALLTPLRAGPLPLGQSHTGGKNRDSTARWTPDVRATGLKPCANWKTGAVPQVSSEIATENKKRPLPSRRHLQCIMRHHQEPPFNPDFLDPS